MYAEGVFVEGAYEGGNFFMMLDTIAEWAVVSVVVAVVARSVIFELGMGIGFGVRKSKEDTGTAVCFGAGANVGAPVGFAVGFAAAGRGCDGVALCSLTGLDPTILRPVVLCLSTASARPVICCRSLTHFFFSYLSGNSVTKGCVNCAV